MKLFSIGNNIQKKLWNNSSNLMKKINISRLELQRWPLEFIISFSKVYIWDLGLRFSKFLLGSCNQYLDRTDEFSEYVFQTSESTNLLWKFLLPITSNTYFLGRVMYVKYGLLHIFDTVPLNQVSSPHITGFRAGIFKRYMRGLGTE